MISDSDLDSDSDSGPILTRNLPQDITHHLEQQIIFVGQREQWISGVKARGPELFGSRVKQIFDLCQRRWTGLVLVVLCSGKVLLCETDGNYALGRVKICSSGSQAQIKQPQLLLFFDHHQVYIWDSNRNEFAFISDGQLSVVSFSGRKLEVRQDCGFPASLVARDVRIVWVSETDASLFIVVGKNWIQILKESKTIAAIRDFSVRKRDNLLITKDGVIYALDNRGTLLVHSAHAKLEFEKIYLDITWNPQLFKLTLKIRTKENCPNLGWGYLTSCKFYLNLAACFENEPLASGGEALFLFYASNTESFAFKLNKHAR